MDRLGEVDTLLASYKGAEDALLQGLELKYLLVSGSGPHVEKDCNI